MQFLISVMIIIFTFIEICCNAKNLLIVIFFMKKIISNEIRVFSDIKVHQIEYAVDTTLKLD